MPLSLALLLLSVSCKNPASVSEPFAEAFQLQYPTQEMDLPPSGKRIHFAWSGSPQKRPLLFVHGSPGSWRGWSEFLMNKDFQDRFHVLSVDRPGFGGSDPGVAERSLGAQAENIIRVLDLNKSSKKAILVGHSFGGPVIAKMAMTFPDKVAGLVFVASSVDPDLETTKWFQHPAQWVPFRWLIPTELKVCNEEILELKTELATMLPEWRKIEDFPSVIIQGLDDPLVPPANADFLAARLTPQALVEKQLVSHLNHFVPWLRPELIVNAIHALRTRVEQTESVGGI